MLDEQVINKELAFVMLRLLIDPKLPVGNVRIPIMLVKVREFLVYLSADVAAVHNPNLDVSASIILAQIWRFQCFCHVAPFRMSPRRKNIVSTVPLSAVP
jgi:hypothetical protein